MVLYRVSLHSLVAVLIWKLYLGTWSIGCLYSFPIVNMLTMLLLLSLKLKQVKIFTVLNLYSLQLTIDAGYFFSGCYYIPISFYLTWAWDQFICCLDKVNNLDSARLFLLTTAMSSAYANVGVVVFDMCSVLFASLTSSMVRCAVGTMLGWTFCLLACLLLYT